MHSYCWGWLGALLQLPLFLVRKPEYWPDYHPTANSPSPANPQAGVDFPDNPLLTVAGGSTTLGKPKDYPSFGFDNEYGSKTIEVAGFKASKYKITNGQFHAFVKAGGYNQPTYWSKEGWGWRTFRNVKWPTFWVPGELLLNNQ
jgi:formylglycine-generating enzyme required for sulfatase activity